MAKEKVRDPVSKALDVLTALVESSGDVGVRQIASELQISPSSVHRILNALVQSGFARKDSATSRYTFGLEFLRISHIVTKRLPIRSIAATHMRQLAEQTDETVVLGLYDKDKLAMMFAEEEVPTAPFSLRYVIELNKWIPVYAGATGLAIMAFLPDEDVEAIIKSTKLKALTDKSISDPGQFRKELQLVRKRGYAVSRGQRIENAGAIAAPIFSNDGYAIGDICVATPKQNLNKVRESELAEMVMYCANQVTRELGGQRNIRFQDFSE